MQNLLSNSKTPVVLSVAIVLVLAAAVVAAVFFKPAAKKFRICSGAVCVQADEFAPTKERSDCIGWKEGVACGSFLIIQNHE
jgi:hypothetical protein